MKNLKGGLNPSWEAKYQPIYTRLRRHINQAWKWILISWKTPGKGRYAQLEWTRNNDFSTVDVHTLNWHTVMTLLRVHSVPCERTGINQHTKVRQARRTSGSWRWNTDFDDRVACAAKQGMIRRMNQKCIAQAWCLIYASRSCCTASRLYTWQMSLLNRSTPFLWLHRNHTLTEASLLRCSKTSSSTSLQHNLASALASSGRNYLIHLILDTTETDLAISEGSSYVSMDTLCNRKTTSKFP